jgi:outer membrane lipoprotein-sorting protein
MVRRLTFVALLASLAVFPLVASAQTVDEIVAKTVAAQGLKNLKAVQTLRATGTMTITPPGLELPVLMEAKRPNKARMTFEVQGTENIQAYDGQNGWTLMPAQGKTSPEPATADELKDLEEQADIDGALVDYKAKGHTIELVGKEPVQGTDTYKLKVTLKNGDVQYYYIDSEHYLPIRIDGTRIVNGTELKVETYVGDYKTVNGVLLPHSMETNLTQVGVTQKVTIDKFEMDVPIDDARFKKPEVK